MANSFDCSDVKLPVSKKDYSRIEKKNSINIFSSEYDLIYLVHVSDQKFKNCMDLLLITNDNKLHYVYIKDFNRFMWNKTKQKDKKHLFRSCLHCFSREKVSVEHIKICLKVNGKQSVILKNETITFNNHFKQLAVPSKIYASFESVLIRVQNTNKDSNSSYTEKYQENIRCSFAYKFVCLANQLFFTERKMQSINSLHQFLMSIKILEE